MNPTFLEDLIFWNLLKMRANIYWVFPDISCGGSLQTYQISSLKEASMTPPDATINDVL